MSDKKSFENAKNSWLGELQETADDDSTLKQCTMLVGNKTDLTPVVNEAEHQASVKILGMALSARTSAKTGDGVNSAFEELVVAVYDADKEKAGGSMRNNRGQGGRQGLRLQPQQEQPKRGCCGGRRNND